MNKSENNKESYEEKRKRIYGCECEPLNYCNKCHPHMAKVTFNPDGKAKT